jgi:hypothetical protein
MGLMNHIDSIQFVTDDYETVTVFIKEAIAEIDENQVVNLQVPVFADGRSGHIYLTGQEVMVLAKSPVIREATKWALNTRLTRYTPRLPKN